MTGRHGSIDDTSWYPTSTTLPTTEHPATGQEGVVVGAGGDDGSGTVWVEWRFCVAVCVWRISFVCVAGCGVGAVEEVGVAVMVR